ncbi:phage holin family protein [Agathobacter rectalis]|jgi:toxin secretion/phage lysis holin|uniref:Phage-related holin (Lysis protein) n=1 Tax=Agathobacter rectalis TaxID=39491 RepID=A0A174GVG0_9FIRM|nr:phage holin family protein [Agathobacter rectalis]CUO65108.1 Phage-related holin (Lysis protein) [Agathobacter rectalis]
MENINTIKTIVTWVAALLSALLGTLYIPVLLMILCNIIDYVTGLMAAKNRPDGGISSYRSIKGIKKKVSMWLLVVVGAILDQLLLYASQTIGVKIPVTFLIACVVAIWIVCNEIISILENMIDIGIQIPSFLLPLVKNIKSQTEHIASTEQTEREE